jgi:basic membrane protein A and related proteins
MCRFALRLIGLSLCLLGVVTITAQEDNLIDSVCLVLNVGNVNDGTFNQAAFEGMQAVAGDYALQDTNYYETDDLSEAPTNIQRCLDEDYDIVITVGFQLADDTLEAAQNNPDHYFIGVDHSVSDPIENYVGIQFRDDEAGFLAGYMAGLVTETGIVGGVYGPPLPPLMRFRNGFEQGVALAARERDVPITPVGVYLDAFDEPDAGAEAARHFMLFGVDVIFGAGGLSGSGAILEAARQDTRVIGVDQDEYFTTFQAGEVPGAENIITSVLKRVDVGVYDMVSLLLDENFEDFPGGDNYSLSVAKGGISFANPHEADLAQDVIDRVIAVEEALAAGEVTTGVDPETGELITETE